MAGGRADWLRRSCLVQVKKGSPFPTRVRARGSGRWGGDGGVGWGEEQVSNCPFNVESTAR